MKPAIILDRDGTLVDFVRDEESGAILSAFHPSHLRLLPGAVDGLLAFQKAGYLLAVATNQPGPAKGQYTEDAIARTNGALRSLLLAKGVDLAAVAYCPHHPTGGTRGDPERIRECSCRKPKPGLVDLLVERYDLDRSASWMVGDTWSDVECGRAAGLWTGLLMAPGRCEFCPRPRPPWPDAVGATLADMAEAILGSGHAGKRRTASAPLLHVER